jgi:cobalt-zinc-cadmium efflux system outer membrane protein
VLVNDVKQSIKKRVLILLALTVAQTFQGTTLSVFAQADRETQSQQAGTTSLTQYVDLVGGMTADEAVAYAISHNPELQAVRKEVQAAQAQVKQARLRPNPMLDVNGSKLVNGPDNSLMVSGTLPLELGGRRTARVQVAEREVEVRERMVADRERMLAGEVRAKFGEALAEVLKLGFTEDLLTTTRRGYKLVVARVVEGRTAPLEQNMVLVEVNRLRSIREMSEGKVQVAMLELRNLVGMRPEEPLRLKGDFANLLDRPLSQDEATTQALALRPDVQAARAMERLAEAQIKQARSEGRADMSLTAGYQRMRSGFPLKGVDEGGQLMPIDMTFNFLTFGATVNLPVRNKNLGAIEAAVINVEAAKQRREAAELTVRREVAAAYVRFEHAARAMEIFRAGVRDQANANLNVVRQTYELGSKTLLDYIAEQRRFIEVETEFINAMLDTYQARIEIERASASPELITK